MIQTTCPDVEIFLRHHTQRVFIKVGVIHYFIAILNTFFKNNFGHFPAEPQLCHVVGKREILNATDNYRSKNSSQ